MRTDRGPGGRSLNDLIKRGIATKNAIKAAVEITKAAPEKNTEDLINVTKLADRLKLSKRGDWYDYIGDTNIHIGPRYGLLQHRTVRNGITTWSRGTGFRNRYHAMVDWYEKNKDIA